MPASLLAAVLSGGVFLGRTAQQPRDSRTVAAAGPRVRALAPDAVLPPSTPPFSPRGPDLLGNVVSTRGGPVAGARVFIDTAGPRLGRGYT